MQTAEIVLTHYEIQLKEIQQLSGGLIHRTYKVLDEKGDAYILQKVAPIFAPTVMKDTQAVLEHLESEGFVVEQIVKTTDGSLFHEDGDCFWRVFTFIEGVTYASATEELAKEAGELLGAYHVAFSTFKYEFQHVRSIKHNFEKIYSKYETVAKPHLPEALRAEAEELGTMLTLLPPSHFVKHITHGDPKLTNFIFSEVDKPRALAIIDLDDCGAQYNAAIEVAKAFKSWSAKEVEQEFIFDVSLFRAAVKGYVSKAKGFLTDEEWSWVLDGMLLLCLELGARFLIDVVEDSYFDWDQEKFASRKEHNIARFKEQMSLYRSIKAEREPIVDSINNRENLT